MTADLTRIRARIQALRAMTTDRGCTPAEALAAATKAAELLAAHGLDEAALETALAEAREVELAGRRTPLDNLWPGVALFADCRCYHSSSSSGGRVIVYFGAPAAVLVAEYVHEVIRRAAGDGLAAYRASADYQRRRLPKTRAAAARAWLTEFVVSVGQQLVLGLWKRKGLDGVSPEDGVARIQAALSPLDDELARRGIALRRKRPLAAGKTAVKDIGRAKAAGAAAGRAVRIDAPLRGAAPAAGLLGEQ